MSITATIPTKDRDEEPCFMVYYHETGTTCWFRRGDGFRHREDGPSVIYSDGIVEWHFEDKGYTFEKWCELTNKTDEEIVQLKLQYGRYGNVI